jgi:hypothetical protein
MPNVSLTAPTDYATELAAIERRRKLAELLAQQSMEPIQSAAPNAPISWTQGLAKILQGYNAGQSEKKADAEAKDLAARQQADQSGDVQRLIAALGGQQAKTIQPDPQEAQQSADQGTPQVAPVNIPAMNPQQSLQAALPEMRTPMGQQMASIYLMKQLNPDEKFGHDVKFTQDGKPYLVSDKGTVKFLDSASITPREKMEAVTTASAMGTPQTSFVNPYQPQQPLAQPVRNEFVNLGGSSQPVNPYLQNAPLTHTTSPDASARLAEEQRHNKATEAQAADKPLTESQAKAAVFASQMHAATDELGKIPGYDPNSVSAQTETKMAGTGMNVAAGPTAQRAKQAQSQWAEAFLRFKTGAASTPAEVELNVRTFFPQIGDGPEVVAQKARARAQAERDLSIAAGRSAAVVNPNAAKPFPGATEGFTYIGMRPGG